MCGIYTFDSCKISFIVDTGQTISIELFTKVNLQRARYGFDQNMPGQNK